MQNLFLFAANLQRQHISMLLLIFQASQRKSLQCMGAHYCPCVCTKVRVCSTYLHEKFLLFLDLQHCGVGEKESATVSLTPVCTVG